jgi:hypothetical protein
MRVREGKSQIGRRSGIGRWRIEHVWVLTLAGHVARDRVGAADARFPAWVRWLLAFLSFPLVGRFISKDRI